MILTVEIFWPIGDLITSITQHLVLQKINSNYHHHEQVQGWSVAVSTRCFQCSQSWVYFDAELRPTLRGWRSASRVRSQVWRGRPGGRLQLNYGATKTLSLTYLQQGSQLLDSERQTGRQRQIWKLCRQSLCLWPKILQFLTIKHQIVDLTLNDL